MQQRDPRAYLWDAREAALAIQTFVQGLDAEGCTASPIVRAAVERKFEIIGEAINQLAKLDPARAARIPQQRQIVAFRFSADSWIRRRQPSGRVERGECIAAGFACQRTAPAAGNRRRMSSFSRFGLQCSAKSKWVAKGLNALQRIQLVASGADKLLCCRLD